MSFTVPQEVVEHLNKIFPRSKDRITMSLSLLGFDHNPTPAEIKAIAKIVKRDHRAVEIVLERLVEENLFASEIGSVPLYRAREKTRLSSSLGSFPAKPAEQAPAEPTETATPIGDEELPVYPIEADEGGVEEAKKEAEMKEGKEKIGEANEKKEDPSRGILVPLHSDASLQDIKDIKVRQQNFETVVKTEFSGIKELLKKALERPKPAPPEISSTVPIVSGLKGQPQQSAAETSVEQTANPGPAASPNLMDPFASMSKEEVVEFYQNNPIIAGRRLPGGLSETYVASPPETIRKIIIEVTTYTQMLYEKALADGAFEGTFSDFLNWAPAKYFEDRGLSLGWHRVDRHPGGRYG